MTEQLALLRQKNKLAEAIHYTLSRASRLRGFINDGRIETDPIASKLFVRNPNDGFTGRYSSNCIFTPR